MSSFAEYSVVIPVLKPEVISKISPLLDSLATQSARPAELHLVAGDKRQGRAINFGVRQANTKYIATLDDDTELDDPRLFEKLLAVMEADQGIGMAGAACEIPQKANALQKRAMREIPRRFFPRQTITVDSDMVQHPCLIMPRELFLRLGGEDEELIRGLDPVLRKKVRDAGKRVVIAADTWVYHLIPGTLPEILGMYYRNGRGSGYGQRYFPERVLELSDGYDRGSFTEKRSFAFRSGRRILGMLASLARGRIIRTLTDAAYILGVAREKLLPSPMANIPAVDKVDSCERPGYPFRVMVHSVSLRTDK